MKDLINRLKQEVNYLNANTRPCKKPYSISKVVNNKAKKALQDIDRTRNHSWAIDIFNKNVDNLDLIAIQYRGNNITYKTMFEFAYSYALSLNMLGFSKGDEIPVCVTNIPEFIYLFLATSFIGAKINVVGDWFNEEYLTEIFNKTQSKYIFVDDNVYSRISGSINKSNIENIIMFSLTDSLLRDKNGNPFNPYDSIESKFHKFENKVIDYRDKSTKPIFSTIEFVKFGERNINRVLANTDLNAPLTITYTSGTTSPGKPKGVIHSNRSYITLARFYEPDVSGMYEMKDLKFLGHISTDTHISLSCGISDTLYCGCTYDCEPFYSKEFFPYSLLINKSNFVTAGSGFWVYLSKLLNDDEKWKKINMPFLMIPIVTGESCSPGEEKFLNYTSRKHKFGTDKLPFPLSPVTFSIGGGTTEGTGIFVTLFKSLMEKLPNNIIKKEGLGLTPLPFAEIEVLNEEKDYCKIGEPGLLVEKSPCEMLGYTDSSLNAKTRIIDKYGKEWLSLGVYSYKSDNKGRIKMKGRMNDTFELTNGVKYPLYYIEDCILKDTKNVMSCTVVKVDNVYVCHIELQPIRQKKDDFILKSIFERLVAFIPCEILDYLYIRIRNNEESFPLDPSGKRSISALRLQGLDEQCISFSEFKSKCNKIKGKTKRLIYKK